MKKVAIWVKVNKPRNDKLWSGTGFTNKMTSHAIYAIMSCVMTPKSVRFLHEGGGGRAREREGFYFSPLPYVPIASD